MNATSTRRSGDLRTHFAMPIFCLLAKILAKIVLYVHKTLMGLKLFTEGMSLPECGLGMSTTSNWRTVGSKRFL